MGMNVRDGVAPATGAWPYLIVSLCIYTGPRPTRTNPTVFAEPYKNQSRSYRYIKVMRYTILRHVQAC